MSVETSIPHASELDGTIEQLLAGRGGTALARGGADIFSGAIRDERLRVLRMAAEQSESPYGGWRSVLIELEAYLGELTPVQRDTIANLIDRPDAGRLPPLSTYQSQYRAFDAVRALLATAAKDRPLVISMSRPEELDITSLRLVRFLLPFLQQMPVLLIAPADKNGSPTEGSDQAISSFANRLAELLSPAHTSGLAIAPMLPHGFASLDASARWAAAAEFAKSLGAPEHAARYLEQAITVDDPGKRLALRRELLLAAAEAGRHEELPVLIARWIEDAGGSASADEASTLVLQLHEAGAPRDTIAPLLTLVEQSDGELTSARMRLLEPPVLVEVSDGRVKVGRWIGMDPAAVKVLREQGTDQDYARTLIVYDWWPKEDVEALVARQAGWSNEADRGRALSVAAETLMYRHGEFHRACELLEEQYAMHQRRGAIEEEAKSLVRLSMALLADGQLDRAEDAREKARHTVERLGPDYIIYEHSGTKSGGDLYPEISMESNFAWYREGDWLAVAEHWARAVAMHEQGGSPVHIVEAAMAAQAYARLDRPEDARIYLDELSSILPHLKPRDWAFNGAVGRASHAIWDMLDRKYAPDFLRYARQLLAAGVGDWTNTSLELTVARMAALVGDFPLATEYFGKARQRHGALQAPQRAIIDFDEAIALRLAGAGSSPNRQELLTRAREGFRGNGMHGWERRADAEALRGN